ncbi:hypothetical protein [uncultured Limimaricola sp.]|uniref:hypothetical protein n=1 Tax=uncultured Limimaricola sp. TaxID=2211667 RepID=UPI0030F5644C
MTARSSVTVRATDIETAAEVSDLARSRAEAQATQDRLRQTTLVATISSGESAAPKIALVEDKPASSQAAATRYAAANTPAAPAKAIAEMRA